MSSLRRTQWRFYLYLFFYDFIFAYPIYAILFQRRGMNILQVSLLLMWWSGAAGLFELPTGALADHWQRRSMLILAPWIKGLCFITWFLADGSFWLFALGFTLWSAGTSLVSGTIEAMMYDALAQQGRTVDYEKARGRQLLFHYLANGIVCITGSVIAYYNIDATLLLSLPSLVVASVVAMTMTEPPRAIQTQHASYFVHFRNLWRELRANGTFRYVLAYQMLAIGVISVMDEYDSLYYTFVGVPLYAIGWFHMVRAIAEAAGNSMAYRLKGVETLEGIAPLATGVLLILVGAFPGKAMIALIILSYLVMSAVGILIEGRLQNSIRTASRATVLSGTSLLHNLSGICLSFAFGLVARRWGLGGGYVLFGIILLTFSLRVFGRSRRDSAPHKKPCTIGHNNITRL